MQIGPAHPARAHVNEQFVIPRYRHRLLHELERASSTGPGSVTAHARIVVVSAIRPVWNGPRRSARVLPSG